jgi:hypothetical protein
MRPITLGRAILAATVLSAGAAGAAVLNPASVTVSVPAGSNDPVGPTYTDDVLLDTLTFIDGFGNPVVYDGRTGSLAAASSFKVLSGREKFNAEWGDADDGADGDGNPFQKAGVGAHPQETVRPDVQDRALLEAFNSRSISEITDGEAAGTGSFAVTFSKSLAFDDVGGDALPDIVFVERGGNDLFSIELILGGTAAAPVYSSALTVDSGSFARSGVFINTVEISNAQELFIGGFDLSAFNLSSNDLVSGFRLTTSGGPDLGGFFLAAADASTFGGPGPFTFTTAPIPLPAPAFLLIAGLGSLALLRRQRRSA